MNATRGSVSRMDVTSNYYNAHTGAHLGVIFVGVVLAEASYGQAATPAQSEKVVEDIPAEETKASAAASKVTDPAIPADVIRELEAMRARIDQLEKELKASDSAPSMAPAPQVGTSGDHNSASLAFADPAQESHTHVPHPPANPPPSEPFAYADWTWLNGNPRNKDVVWDSKFFTPGNSCRHALHCGL